MEIIEKIWRDGYESPEHKAARERIIEKSNQLNRSIRLLIMINTEKKWNEPKMVELKQLLFEEWHNDAISTEAFRRLLTNVDLRHTSFLRQLNT